MNNKKVDGFSIGEIYEDDLTEVKYLIDEVTSFTYKSQIPEEGYEYFKENMWGIDMLKKDARDGCTLVVKDNGKIIGTGTIVGDYISKIYIKPEYHGLGLGKLIMESLKINLP